VERVDLVRSIAAGQDGLITRAQARQAGFARHEIDNLVSSNRWWPLARAVYLVDAGRQPPGRRRSLIRAAVLSRGPNAHAVFATAAEVHGIGGLPRSDEIHLAVPGTSSKRARPREPAVILHQLEHSLESIVMVDGIPVTDVLHTVAEVVLRADRYRAVAVLDAALCNGFLEPEQLGAVSALLRRRRGAVAARSYLAEADGRAQSPLETRVRLRCVDGDVAPDVLQHEVRDEDGYLLGVGDLAWLKGKVIAEADGRAPHGTPQAVFADRRRQNLFVNAGWTVLRFTWADTLRRDYIPYSVRTAGLPTAVPLINAKGGAGGRVGSGGVRVLLIGSGGREHALALALAADPSVHELIAAPGNPGIGQVAELRPVDIAEPAAIAALTVETGADLVVIGPEAPLVAGAADAVRAKGVPCFGPSAAAARIEGSKAFAKEVMTAAAVPTARARTCTDVASASAALDEFGLPYVVKNDGLAAGKGVVVTDDRATAERHAAECGRVVIEEYLAGPEVSLFALTDGDVAVPLLPAQDFKRVGDGDTGPNTGGMGAYAPLPWAPPGLVDDVMAAVVRPTLAELRRRGTPFAGLLYVGLALTPVGPKVIEFNARFGDPETQVVLELLETPLAGLLLAAATGTLASHPPPKWRGGAAVTVVVAAEGYPAKPRTGDVIAGAEQPGIIHAGTARNEDGVLVTAGGRVASATATGATLAAARERAYALADGVRFAGAHYRRDIARTAAEGRG
jgi:phosphoribosylamine---glycine ligase